MEIDYYGHSQKEIEDLLQAAFEAGQTDDEAVVTVSYQTGLYAATVDYILREMEDRAIAEGAALFIPESN